VSDNVHIICAGNGKKLQDSLPNVAVAGGRNTVVKIARAKHGPVIVHGVGRRLESALYLLFNVIVIAFLAFN